MSIRGNAKNMEEETDMIGYRRGWEVRDIEKEKEAAAR